LIRNHHLFIDSFKVDLKTKFFEQSDKKINRIVQRVFAQQAGTG
jgi:hypothetical protein